jgi:hypothetical protein
MRHISVATCPKLIWKHATYQRGNMCHINVATYQINILSRVYGSVTNNNGFWIGWLDLLAPSCTVAPNYNQSSLTAEDSPHSSLRSATPYNWTTLTLVSSRHGPRTENTALLLLHALLLGFPRDCYPASPLARWLLISNGLCANHIEYTAAVLLTACLFERVYLATSFSGSIA